MDKVAAQRPNGGGAAPEVTPKNIWRHPNAHPLVLSLLLLDKYGEEYLEWDAEVLRETMRKDGIQLSNSVWAKIMAVQVLLTSPSPWRQWEVFHWVARGLAGKQPNIVYLELPELGHLAAMADTAKLIDPERKPTDDIDRFIAVAAKDAGVDYLPSPLSFAQRILDDRKITCKDCGLVEQDDNDVTCVACGSSNVHKIPGPNDAVRDEAKALYEKLKHLPLEEAVDHVPHDTMGNGVYKLLTHWDYRNQVRQHLIQQLHSVAK